MAFTNYAEVTVEGELHGQQTVNVWHFARSGAGPTLDDLIADIIECIRTALLPALSADWKLVQVRAKEIWPTLTDEVVVAGIGTDVGALTESLPSYDAAVLSLRTGFGGRSARGRKYIAGIPEGRHEASALTGPEITALAAYVACLAGKFFGTNQTSDWKMGVYSRKEARASNAAAGAGFRPVSNIIVRQDIGTMRSRKLGRGR